MRASSRVRSRSASAWANPVIACSRPRRWAMAPLAAELNCCFNVSMPGNGEEPFARKSTRRKSPKCLCRSKTSSTVRRLLDTAASGLSNAPVGTCRAASSRVWHSTARCQAPGHSCYLLIPRSPAGFGHPRAASPHPMSFPVDSSSRAMAWNASSAACRSSTISAASRDPRDRLRVRLFLCCARVRA